MAAGRPGWSTFAQKAAKEKRPPNLFYRTVFTKGSIFGFSSVSLRCILNVSL